MSLIVFLNFQALYVLFETSVHAYQVDWKNATMKMKFGILHVNVCV